MAPGGGDDDFAASRAYYAMFCLAQAADFVQVVEAYLLQQDQASH